MQRTIEAIPTSDGAGVKLRRSLGQSAWARLDPLLMLDHFSTERADDYIAGFPAHPHRGFETVTYMLDGHMRHEDHLGHTGELKSGGVQWMTAGRGIVHSEMPQQEQGRMRGFQLWINLPAKEKMKPAAYRDIQPDTIPVVELAGGVRVKVIAGTLAARRHPDARTYPGADHGSALPRRRVTGWRDLHASDPPRLSRLRLSLRGQRGDRSRGGSRRPLKSHYAGVLSDGDDIELTGGPPVAASFCLAGRPLLEPIVQYGPFVMNTREEIEQAIRDYQSGTLTGAG